jgi:flagellar hook-length control protein FliK|tara:strand:- start:203 stop:1468 length:1266 start_codon:yes stop_codon:yes gene_type:complete
MTDLEKIFLSKEFTDFAVKTSAPEEQSLDNTTKTSFENIFQSQFHFKNMANHGKDLPIGNAESHPIHHRKLPGGTGLFLAGNEPSDSSLMDYAKAQGIDPEAMSLLMSNIEQEMELEEGPPKEQVPTLSDDQLVKNTLIISNQKTTGFISSQDTDYLSIGKRAGGHITLAQTLAMSKQTQNSEVPKAIPVIAKTQNIIKSFNPNAGKSTLKLEAIQLGERVESILELKDGRTSSQLVQNQTSPLRQDLVNNPGQTGAQELRTELSNKQSTQGQFSEPNNDLSRRHEQYLEVSKRLTQAVGERLSAQIAKGAWRVEMDLHPKTLGRIEIQLEMKNGELEAHFNSSQTITRDLLQESFSKLKDILSEHGIDSAYIGLGTGENRHSDGNSTDEKDAPFAQNSETEEMLTRSEVSSQSEGLDVKV